MKIYPQPHQYLLSIDNYVPENPKFLTKIPKKLLNYLQMKTLLDQVN